jgi:transposase
MVFPENITTRLAIDESSLSQGELNTFVSSRDIIGRKGKLIAMVSSILSVKIAEVLPKIPKSQRELVQEVTLVMASSIRKACELAFPNAVLVTDRFHVVRLVMDAKYHVLIDQRWKELDIENQANKKA